MNTRSTLALVAFTFACNRAPAPADKPAEALPEAAAKTSAATAVVANAEDAVKTSAGAQDGEHKKDDGCVYNEGEGKHACEDQKPAAADGKNFGAALTLAKAEPLKQAVTQFTDADKDKVVQVSGTVDSVCQKKGCWLVVKDGEQTARVLMKDHAFVVPFNIVGKPVVVEGTLAKRTFTEAQVKHLEQDRGGNPDAFKGERAEYVLTATSVQLQG